MRLGLEVVREDRRILAVRPHSGIPEPFLLSVPFVNSHSHLEYRAFQGELDGLEYWPWIRELTRRKAEQSADDVRESCNLAARENRATGVGFIGEHSDRPFSGEALASVGIGGVIFQEVITFFESESPHEKLATVERNAAVNRTRFPGEVLLNPHALYTVDRETLVSFAGRRISLHLAESRHERAFFEEGHGPIAELYERFGSPFSVSGRTPTSEADELGLIGPHSQLVHCCDLDHVDIQLVAASRASVAHCPRSNTNLGCPQAPIRELLDAGVPVGLGMDSPASSGPIDMFAEMRSCSPRLTGEAVWNMATTLGAETLGFRNWNIEPGLEGPLIAIEVEGAQLAEDVIRQGSPEKVRWIE